MDIDKRKMDYDEPQQEDEKKTFSAGPKDVASIARGSDGEDQDGWTAQTVLRAIENAWLNEKFAPEILPHQSDMVDCMLQQITHMEQNTKGLARADTRLTIHRMEMDRIRFVISSYLRIRLEKIERYAISILSEEARRAPEDCYLTGEETKFAKEYLSGVETLFRTVALRHMPNNFQQFQIDNLAVKPNTHAHVFLRANRNISGIVIPGTLDQEIYFEAGSQHIIRYKAVADLVKNGSVQLI